VANQQKIAFLCHPYHRGGVTRWMADAAIAYASRGTEVYFITPEPMSEFFSAKGRETLLQLLAPAGDSVHRVTTKVDYEFEFGTPQYKAYIYKQLITKVPPGTPIILSDDNAVWEAATYMRSAYPIVGVLHADENHYYHLAEKYFREVDLLVCVSDRVNKTTRQRVPAFPTEKICTIPCGINLPAIDYNTPQNEILQLVYVGRVSDFQKRTVDLIKIAVSFAKNYTAFHLNIIGDGDARIPLTQKVKEAGLEQYVTFQGWLSQAEVARYLSASDILLLTSDFEGTPIAMMEALAAGCGMVGTRVSGIEDYEHNTLAADCLGVYTVGDIEDAVKKINTVASIPRKRRMVKARTLAESQFSMEVCLKKYSDAIATIKTVPPSPRQISLSFSDGLYSRLIALARYIKMSLTSR
jgi:glycosyltransferase involved in cell wall biosynthesis